jgi:hypothetical protein
MYPMRELIDGVAKFRDTFPLTPLRLFVEALGAVIEPVLQGACQIGIVGSLPVLPESIHSNSYSRCRWSRSWLRPIH